MDNLRAIIFMCLAMAGFALEDFIIKIIAEETPISQILITIGCLGTVLFSFIALAVKAPIFSADILTFPVIFRSIADLFGAFFLNCIERAFSSFGLESECIRSRFKARCAN